LRWLDVVLPVPRRSLKSLGEFADRATVVAENTASLGSTLAVAAEEIVVHEVAQAVSVQRVQPVEEQVAILSRQKPGPWVVPHGCRELVRVHRDQLAGVVALQLSEVPPVRPEDGLADPCAFINRLLLSLKTVLEVHARAL